MKTIGMPAYKLTGNCIWNSFQNSNKKHILITGNRGSGKSTLLKKIFPHPLPGVTTWAKPKDCVYLKENTGTSTVKVGIYDPTIQGLENKMRLVEKGFSDLGITALKNAIAGDFDWISIDEIGYLEANCPEYLDTISLAMEKKHVIAVIRKQNLLHLKKLCERKDVFFIDLDSPTDNMGCIIMASGMGTRFGENKLMSCFHQKPMISYVLEATKELFPKRIVVTRHEEVVNFCNQVDVDVIFHTLPHRSDTIRLGMEKMTDVKHCMFCTADQPLLSQDTILSLALLAVNHPTKILRPVFENAPGSPVIFPQWAFEELRQLPQGQGGGYVIKKHPLCVQYLTISNKYELKDIDTKEDLINLEKL